MTDEHLAMAIEETAAILVILNLIQAYLGRQWLCTEQTKYVPY